VLDVQKQLVQAKTDELKALIDYNLAWHTLHRVTGTLLDRERDRAEGEPAAEDLQ
jgi:outer membrane protein TolC